MTRPNADDLWSLFRASEISERDLATILMGYFHSAMPAAPNGIVYPANKRYAIRLVYKDDSLVGIEPGALLDPGTVSKIHEQIERLVTGSRGFRVRRWTLFSDHLPVLGRWKYRDMFLILPAPANAPQPPKHHFVERPFIVEAQYRDAPDPFIRLDRAMVEAKAIALLLNVLLETRVRLPDYAAYRYHWVLTNPDSPPVRVECLREWYHIPDFRVEDESGEMSSTDHVAPLREASHDAYYDRWILGKGNREMEVPDSLTVLLDRFFAAPEQERHRCLRFCFWFRQADEVHSYSATASYLALVQGIEALVPTQRGGPVCGECGKQKGKGPTARFNDFISKHAPGEALAKGRTQLYKLRSTISHGGPLLWTDRQPGFDVGLVPAFSEQIHTLLAAWQVAQRVFVNYLHAFPQPDR